jgi:lipoate-protein ligase A
MTEWRLLDTGSRTAAENMALDDVILDCRANDLSPNTLRLLQFDPTAVLVGYHQSIDQEVRTEYCAKQGIDVNRRLTGGGAIFFDRTSLGWEIFASRSDVGAHQLVDKIFMRMCEGTILALRHLGVPASFRSKNDIEVNGRKISGTGGTARDQAFLFQGTLLIDFDVTTMLRALRIPVMKLKDKEIQSVKERVTCLQWELQRQPALSEIKQALKQGFEKAFHVTLLEGDLTERETELLHDRLPTYQSNEWIYLDRRPLEESPKVSAIEKLPGGLLRVSLILDQPRKVIKAILITGDFFVFPSRSIVDLESQLKFTSYESDELDRRIHNFFTMNQVHLPGVQPEELIKLIHRAIRKSEYGSLGISIDDANHLYAINGELDEILDKNCKALLLPYCAKLISCEYRKQEGCDQCGECSIGVAYALAERYGLTPITIQNFEHLMETLTALTSKNIEGYIGCCCEGFVCKHQDDLKLAGIPGILIDIEDQTCYDLGKETEAIQGRFESQTELKIELLSKLVKTIHEH